MKELRDSMLVAFSDISISDLLDTQVKTIDVHCHNCGHVTRFDEAYISRYQQDAVSDVILRLNSFIEDIDEAILSIYGEDIRMTLLSKKLAELKKELTTPQLKIIK